MSTRLSSHQIQKWIVAVGVVLGVLFCCSRAMWPSGRGAFVRDAGNALSAHQFTRVLDLTSKYLKQAPHDELAYLLGAEAARQNYEYERSGEYLSQLGHCDSGKSAEVAYCRGVEAQQLGRIAQAESFFRDAVSRDSGHLEANRRLMYLLQIQGRLRESSDFVLPILRQGTFYADELLVAGNSGRAYVSDEAYLAACLAADPKDRRVLVNGARQLMMDNQREEARKELDGILQTVPRFIEALLLQGQLLLHDDDREAWIAWHERLPAEAEEYPETWYLRGLWLKQRNDRVRAIRCLLEVVRRDPNHSGAVFQLSQLLAQEGRTDAAKYYADRSVTLSKLDYFISELRNSPDVEMMRQATELLESLQRYWEAMGWCRVALVRDARVIWARQNLKRLSLMASRFERLVETPAFPPSFRPDEFPLPEWKTPSAPASDRSSDSPGSCLVRFEDVAAAAGLEFQYFNGTTETTGLEHMLQSTGGGIGVIDFDQDGLPDLYFAQSGVWPLSSGHGNLDQLFRNTPGGKFEKVTESASLGDDRYSQGVTVGDYNNDGFPDLYVCNVGENRFYENMGDGTFLDVTTRTKTECPVWSLSAGFADLNGDSLPDLYVVNYLRLPEVLARECKHEGRPMGCAPTMFPAEQDRLYLNLGDGQFRDITASSGIVAPDGKGLGLIIADFDDSRRLSVFVGNDTTANFLFSNQTEELGTEPRFHEEGVLRGVAFDEVGKAMSSMGIAAGDANGDGLFDLFITTFYADSNAYFLHKPDHSFEDLTRTAQLRDASFNMLGFGAQFIDGELDGRPDLLVTNGHVDRTFATGVPDLMVAQYFQNQGEGRFSDVTAPTLGPYFRNKCLGRSLVRLDWNRDGVEDACVSHLDRPVALLTNKTSRPGNSLRLQFRGKTVARDAIGTVVRVRSGGSRWTQQLMAGDGYMAANQKQLVFGLGRLSVVDDVEVEWPNGKKQIFHSVSSDSDWIVVEGKPDLVPLPR